jgi:hypothetical protein
MGMSSKEIDRVWVELVGKIIIARIIGEPSEELLELRHQMITQLSADSGCTKLLLDDLQMGTLTFAHLEMLRTLNLHFDEYGFRIAVVVPSSKMAFLARQQFTKEGHRVFYNDMIEAIAWLAQDR